MACTPATPREKGSVEGAVRYLKSGFWRARRFGHWPSSTLFMPGGAIRLLIAIGQFVVGERLVEE